MIIARSEGREWTLQFYFVPLARQRCVGVAAPYKPHANDFIQTWRADDTRHYCMHLFISAS